MITDLTSMVQERLEQYRNYSRKLPRRIIFFRDGVSEGQFYTVVTDELPKIREACVRMTPGGTYRPKITLVSTIRPLYSSSLIKGPISASLVNATTPVSTP